LVLMPNQLSKLLFSVVLAAALGGCELADQLPFGSQAASPPAASTTSSKARPARTTAAKPGDAPAPTAPKNDERQTAVASKKEEGQPQAEASTPNLVGMSEAQVAKVLGPPMAETEKAPGKVWRYWNSRCAVDVSLYLDIQSRAYRVLSYEVTNHGNSSGGRSVCMAELPRSNIQPTSANGR
jgi:hypothetical protein